MNLFRSPGLFAALALVGASLLSLPAHCEAPDAAVVFPFPKQVPVPDDNPMTPAKIALGRKLFFDKSFSLNQKISCNSCHDVSTTGADGKALSPGHAGKLGKRNAPTVFNAALRTVQFWDGRAASLEEQAKGPIINPLEMGMPNHDILVERIGKNKTYVNAFAKTFGPGPITIDHIVKAIATYERTLITPNSPYDRYIAGDQSAISESARKGMTLVRTVGCIACHNGPMFAGPDLPQGRGFYHQFPMNPGSVYDAKYHLLDDLGRFEVTQEELDKHSWRVASWRNVAVTGPYFHNGSVKTLEEAVRVMAKTQLGKTLSDDDVKNIVAFLNTLTAEKPKP